MKYSPHMGSIGFNIRGGIAFPMKNDNWHKFLTSTSHRDK